jgi:hypothetical protein
MAPEDLNSEELREGKERCNKNRNRLLLMGGGGGRGVESGIVPTDIAQTFLTKPTKLRSRWIFKFREENYAA